MVKIRTLSTRMMKKILTMILKLGIFFSILFTLESEEVKIRGVWRAILIVIWMLKVKRQVRLVRPHLPRCDHQEERVKMLVITLVIYLTVLVVQQTNFD